ncbi:MAG: murein L,D-transpeptidase [Chloroflexi bacterium]|nr:MAG: murein L,D-transpeptidase [Chloroflexota bacterium]
MNSPLPNGRVRLHFAAGLGVLLFCGSIGLIVFFIATSPASASFAMVLASPTATQENLWAYADIPKPIQTPAPTILPAEPSIPPVTETADSIIPPVTETPGSMIMEIVEDAAPAAAEPLNQSVPSYGGSKYILVDISEQHMYVYEGDVLVYSFVASTGINNGTRAGTFAVQSKIPNAYGSTWNIWMPSWLGIYWSGGLENGIHALPILSNGATLWEGYLGRPVSYGCVVLGTYEAQLLYDWAEIGTPVEIQW